jgi:hypothetical protein
MPHGGDAGGVVQVQQELASPGVLERFVPDADEARALRSVFAGLYGLEVT